MHRQPAGAEAQHRAGVLRYGRVVHTKRRCCACCRHASCFVAQRLPTRAQQMHFLSSPLQHRAAATMQPHLRPNHAIITQEQPATSHSRIPKQECRVSHLRPNHAVVRSSPQQVTQDVPKQECSPTWGRITPPSPAGTPFDTQNYSRTCSRTWGRITPSSHSRAEAKRGSPSRSYLQGTVMQQGYIAGAWVGACRGRPPHSACALPPRECLHHSNFLKRGLAGRQHRPDPALRLKHCATSETCTCEHQNPAPARALQAQEAKAHRCRSLRYSRSSSGHSCLPSLPHNLSDPGCCNSIKY